MSVVNALTKAQAPLGAANPTGRPLMPLLTELKQAFADGPYYRHAAPNGAGRPMGRRDSCKGQAFRRFGVHVVDGPADRRNF